VVAAEMAGPDNGCREFLSTHGGQG
jgi:hypothetical protein